MSSRFQIKVPQLIDWITGLADCHYQIVSTVRHLDVAHPVRLVRKTSASDILALLGAKPVIKQLLEFVLFNHSAIGLGAVRILIVKESFIIMSPAKTTKLDILQRLLLQVLIALDRSNSDLSPVRALLAHNVRVILSVLGEIPRLQSARAVLGEFIRINELAAVLRVQRIELMHHTLILKAAVFEEIKVVASLERATEFGIVPELSDSLKDKKKSPINIKRRPIKK